MKYTQSLVSLSVQAALFSLRRMGFSSDETVRCYLRRRFKRLSRRDLHTISAAAGRRRPACFLRVRNSYRVSNSNRNRLMPGVAEPDIVLDIAATTQRQSGAADDPGPTLPPRPRLAIRTLVLVLLDAAVTAFAAILCFEMLEPQRPVLASSAAVALACLVLCMTLSFFERGLYAAAEVMSRQLHGYKLVLAWVQAIALGTLLTFCLASVATDIDLPELANMSAILVGPFVPTLLVAGFFPVLAARFLRIRANGGPMTVNRTVIIGEHDCIHDLLMRINASRHRAFDIIGVVEHDSVGADSQRPMTRRSFRGLPLFSGIDALERMIRQDAVDTVLVALPWAAGETAQAIVRRISMAPIDVYIYAGMKSLNMPLRRSGAPYDLPLLMACNRPINGWRGSLKRGEDIVLSLALLTFISPVMLAIAIAVKLTSKGPVFFRQRRIGYNNHVIEILKFRSMYTHLADADAKQQAFRGDKRVTPLGVWLRRTSLDELPQLINVLKGDMSLVGPRPHALATTAGGLALEEAVPVYSSRHRVKPGITGWAQVNGYRGALDSVDKIVHRVNHDLYYIENWSLGLDIKILWQTVRLVFADDNAF
ncbi:MAG: exopolysaccharide biosynthesis polyprenyl glycosylphosphotransferase [Rhodopila sp.]